MISLLYILLGGCGYTVIAKLAKDYYHPSAILVLLWFLSSSLASFEPFYNKQLQNSLSFDAHVSIVVAGASLFFPAFFLSFVSKPRNRYSFFKPNGLYSYCLNGSMLIAIFVFFVRFKSQIFMPTLFVSGISDVKSAVPDGIPFLHYFDLLTPFLAVSALHRLLFCNKTNSLNFVLLLSFIFFSILTIVLYKVSRGELLVIILGSLYLFYAKYQFSILKVFTLFLFVVSIFLFFTYLRVSEAGMVAGYLGDGAWMIFSPVYTYVAINFENFNKLTLVDNFQYTHYVATLKFAINPFYPDLYDPNTGVVKDFSTLFFNARPFLYYFYHDLGVFGVGLFSFFISIFVKLIYIASTQDSKYCLMVAFMQKAIFFIFFGNYFFGDLVLVFPYLFCFFLIILMYRRVRFFH
ncbi:oligosaccharide repeat unit polymerase [Motilimonas cestriensis]|uniref:Oligosaccharide repeat unit polymerase n=1 Tax=Motilimonas cestriensis TaxID=2742685 RepID=A0ABS8W8H9_9GAMM|nr:O-antigen polymerase [Motilimonas cestriensis]MCE2594066.1 oligosaccharide repeat unit polymerase [Motilimonas cestriensis]